MLHERDIKVHLTNVYALLASTVLSAAIGSVIYLATGIGGTLSMFIGIGLIIWLTMTPEEEVQKRISILLGFGLVQGLSLGPIIQSSLDIDPSIVTTAFFGTVCIFGCFSASAYYAPRRSYLFLAGTLGSAVSCLMMIGLVNIFARSSLLMNVSLYGGLLVFCGFVCFDTQMIIEKASNGNKDVVRDSLELFLDFASVFIRLLAILSKKEKRRDRK